MVHCKSFMNDICVAPVPSATSKRSGDVDFVAPRAWVVLSEQGVKQGFEKSAEEIHRVVQEYLSRPKWLRGGIEFIAEVQNDVVEYMLDPAHRMFSRSQEMPQGRYSVASYRRDTREPRLYQLDFKMCYVFCTL